MYMYVASLESLDWPAVAGVIASQGGWDLLNLEGSVANLSGAIAAYMVGQV